MRQLKISTKITNRDSVSLERYLNEISKLEMITPEQEVQLAREIKLGSTIALEKLTNANLRFVVSVAKQYQNQGLLLSDLINEGNLGLIKAAKKFDETKGFKFISYAVWWIRQSIMQALVEQSRLVRLPVNKVGSSHKIYKMAVKFEQKYQREPSDKELSELMDMTEKQVKEIRKNDKRHLYIDAPISDEESSTMLDLMKNEDIEPDHDLIKNSLTDEIKHMLSILNEKEKEIIELYFGLKGNSPISLEDIGLRLELTRERVRQIKDRAIRRMRKMSGSEQLKTYLG